MAIGIPTKFLVVGGGLITLFVLAWLSLHFSNKTPKDLMNMGHAPLGSAGAKPPMAMHPPPPPPAMKEDTDPMSLEDVTQSGTKNNTDFIFREFWKSQIPYGESEFTWIK